MNLEKIKVLTDLRDSLKDGDGVIFGKYSELEDLIISNLKGSIKDCKEVKSCHVCKEEFEDSTIYIERGKND